ncbi:hypothetical protein GCM10009850_088670 [Nonomuraea monospora]|uniref:Uncharacterized protein n=1 Tax=Nonomuraea monospora TaxID=568818 RepID=A0ABP5PP19_9ACTN
MATAQLNATSAAALAPATHGPDALSPAALPPAPVAPAAHGPAPTAIAMIQTTLIEPPLPHAIL